MAAKISISIRALKTARERRSLKFRADFAQLLGQSFKGSWPVSWAPSYQKSAPRRVTQRRVVSASHERAGGVIFSCTILRTQQLGPKERPSLMPALENFPSFVAKPDLTATVTKELSDCSGDEEKSVKRLQFCLAVLANVLTQSRKTPSRWRLDNERHSSRKKTCTFLTTSLQRFS